MNTIIKHDLTDLGYNFIDPIYIPEGKDEYFLRYTQQPKEVNYRNLTLTEIEVLVSNRNTSDDWSKFLVTDFFNPALIKNCEFHGLIRIGKMESFYLEFHNLRLSVGLYNSTIISCDFGDNVCIHNVNYFSHYITGNEVMIANVNEIATTDRAKFGNGILNQNEGEKQRVWMELCNENGGRSIIPFDGMLTGDAFLWSKYRADDLLLQKFKEFTERKFDNKRGYYGTIGDRTVIKNCKIIKDVKIGTDAYLKGANKLKNLTINSDVERSSQIGEGCEIVNGIVGYGCRIFYGAKAVRFVMASHSQLKYGARLINSFLGNNSTISCCEVLNSLIFPAHEQHHNNSFLCAAFIMGQSNIAAGATIGSNHNSRSPDGEIIAGRGFWPGLCVSLKHNSKFASFTIISKGDFPAELNIPVPFSLVSNDAANDKLVIMPGYWFMYNMYALERNAWKYTDRDRRIHKTQLFENDYLAPDTINEMFAAIRLLETLPANEKGVARISGWENSKREIEVIKVPQAIQLFKELIRYYAGIQLLQHFIQGRFETFDTFKESLSAKIQRSEWINIGGQLIQEEEVEEMKRSVKNNTISSWDELHEYYQVQGKNYPANKLNHAYTSLLELMQITPKQFTVELLKELLQESIKTRQWMCKGIYDSRAKDYTNPFRKMVYGNDTEMNNVVGKLEDNTFIQQQLGAFENLKLQVKTVLELLHL